MIRLRQTSIVSAASLVTLLVCFDFAESGAPEIRIEQDAARLGALSFDGEPVTLSSQGGGFSVYDATDKADVAFSHGTVKRGAGKTVFECETSSIRLHAEFTSRNGFLLVTGQLENTRKDERGLILDYRIPLLSADAVFSNALDESVPMADSPPYEGNVFPIAAMCGKDTGIAMAIPPSKPRIFGMVGDAQGMAMRFYLGVSPETRKFPNRAPFAFLLYSVEPGWGFRSALSKYYGFFPDYYAPRLKRDGLFMFQMGDRIPPNVDQYGFDLVETQSAALDAAVARDEQHGIATFPYMIVGQREIKFLDALPRTYDEAMAAYAAWSLADHAGHALTKENSASQGDIHLKEEVESSACKTRDGGYAIVVRNTRWGENSVTFKMNPNPDLFQDENRPTVASYALDLTDRWLKEHPEYDGMFVDSLGRNWPAVLNYRKDHFRYARYPLTLDPQGRVALHNQISHYEYVETLREKMRATGRLVLANGVYAYKPRIAPARRARRQTLDKTLNEYVEQTAPAEHYRPEAALGRFFCAALLDIASSEAGVKATVERSKDVRIFMGRKHYAFLNYAWEDAGKVEEFVNKSLCYGIFASTSTNFFTGVTYENHPNGYLRDKKLLDWYVPLVRRLSRAGWEPVRYGAVDHEDVSCERFGHGKVVYYTLYNDSSGKATCTLEVDLEALGFAEGAAVFHEVARHASLARPKANRVTLELEPKRTCVIRITGGETSA